MRRLWLGSGRSFAGIRITKIDFQIIFEVFEVVGLSWRKIFSGGKLRALPCPFTLLIATMHSTYAGAQPSRCTWKLGTTAPSPHPMRPTKRSASPALASCPIPFFRLIRPQLCSYFLFPSLRPLSRSWLRRARPPRSPSAPLPRFPSPLCFL